MVRSIDTAVRRSAPVRSSLSEFEGFGLDILRPCLFSFPAKILTPLDDILVPLVTSDALADLNTRSGISGVIATPELAASVPEALGLAVADDPMRVHYEILRLLDKTPGRLWRDFPSEIHETADIHPTAWIDPQSVRIGPDVRIMAGAVVGQRSEIGEATNIHPRAVIGGDAYEIIMIAGRQMLRPQTGGVSIGERCEILTGAIVTRSAFPGMTIVGDHSVLDCNVVVSHDCRIGRDVRIGGASWIGGRVSIGDHASIGPNCTIGNGLAIGDRATVSLGAVVTRDVAADARVSGNFAIEHDKMLEHIRKIR